MPALQYNVLPHLPKVKKEKQECRTLHSSLRKESKNAELFTAHCEGGVGRGWGVLLLLLNSPTKLIAVQQ